MSRLRMVRHYNVSRTSTCLPMNGWGERIFWLGSTTTPTPRGRSPCSPASARMLSCTTMSGRATITIPRNTNGGGYVCYSRPNVVGAFAVRSQRVTQMFEGASDLDIKPAMAGQAVQVGRVFCRQSAGLSATLRFDDRDWSAATTITLEIL